MTSTIQAAYNQWAKTYDNDFNKTRDLDAETTVVNLSTKSVGSILEIGCGTGKNTGLLAEIGESVLGLDFSEEMLTQAKEKASAAHVRFEQADLLKRWPVEACSYDLVVCNLVLEHIEALGPIFEQAAEALRPGGQFYVSEFHPFRQYYGKQARFDQDGVRTLVPAYVHNTTDFLKAAQKSNFQLLDLGEWWHAADDGKPPRLITFLFAKP